MSRFEIQEMVAQSEQGVTYLAHDKQSKQDAALRRFFPFGPNGGGLEGDAAKEFTSKCEVFTEVTHPALRRVIGGGVDSSDKTPYLVTEWVEGQSLTDVLGGAKLDPARAMDVARNALEVSLELSKVFGKQGVWIDTDPNSIVVGSPDSGRGFTFWVGLSRWFGLRPKQREVRSIATLVEQLVGWDSKVYTKDSAGGFGGWVKTLKTSPFMTVEQALEQLSVIGKQGQAGSAATNSNSSAQVKAQPAVVAAPTQVVKGSGPTRPLQSTSQALTSRPTQEGQSQPMPLASEPAGWRKPLIVVAACLAVAGLIAVLVQKNNDAVRRQLAKNEAVEKANEEARAAEQSVAPLHDEGPIRNISTLGQPVRTGPVAGGPKTASPTPGVSDSAEPPLLSPNDAATIKNLAQKAPLRLRGTLADTVRYSDGNVALHFSKPYKKGQIRGLAAADKSGSRLKPEHFKKYIGKEITIEGEHFYYESGDAHYVNFSRIDQIAIKGGKPEPENPKQERLAITPLDYEVIAKLPSKHSARLRGVVKAVMIPEKSSCLKITFDGPADSKLIHVIGCPGNFNGKKNSKEDFGHVAKDLQFLVGKTVLIDGEVSRFNGTTEPHFIRIVRKDQIKVFK